MSLLHLLAQLRNPVLDSVMLLITQFGGEALFLIVALTIFWCFDKKTGYFILVVGFIGTVANQFLKLACRVPRPWVMDSKFYPVEAAVSGAEGYSFPSGHTQNSIGTFGSIAAAANKKWIRNTCLSLCVLVPFSRMYLGVHTPYDVGVAAIMAVGLIFLLRPVFFGEKAVSMKPLFVGMIILAAVFVAYVELYPFPADIDQDNLASGVKSAYTLSGALLGLMVAWAADEHRLHFRTEAIWWAQILKVVLGLIPVLLLRMLLKAPLQSLLGGHYLADGIRYCVMVIFAGIVWPLTFPWFASLGRK